MIDFEPPASLLVPRIVVSLPETGSVDIVLSGKDSPVERRLVADLWIAYAFDQPTCFKMAAKRDLQRLGLDECSVHEVALANLRDKVQSLKPEFLELSNGVFKISCGGNYEATMLLLDNVWVQAAQIMERGTLVVSVPSRDMVAFTSSENHAGLAFLRSKAAEILEHDSHPLTRHFLVREDKNWVVYKGYAD
jgi:uncharacterized protein YtpQ (UPF0354 family)